MNPSTKKAVIVSGTILLLCLPALVLLAYLYVSVTPRQYEAQAKVLLDSPKPGEASHALQIARQRLGGAGTVDRTANTDILTIIAVAASPQEAANKANVVADSLAREHPHSSRAIAHVIEPAYAPNRPVRPKVMLAIVGSLVLGTILAMLGAVFLLVARWSGPVEDITPQPRV